MQLRALALALIASTALGGGALADGLVDAARTGDGEAALELLSSGADAAEAAPDGTTALHWAAHNDDLELARRLVREGADASARNDYGATPLSEAAVVGNVEMLDLLLDAGADANETNADGQTPLMIVARTNNVEAAQRLVRAGADVNAAETWRGQTALMWAAHDQRPAMVQFLLEEGADPNAVSVINEWERQTTTESRAQYRPSGGLTPLLYAAREGCDECVRLLVEGGADVNLVDPDEVSATIIAIDNGHFDVAKYLLENGANPNKWDMRGRTPLWAAINMNTLPHGGRADQPSDDETTALQLARLILDMGVNVDSQLKMRAPYRNVGADRGTDIVMDTGTTPLFRAAKAFDTEAITLLLEHGADPNLPNVSGVTPTTSAAGLGTFDVDIHGRYDTPDVQQRSIEALKLLIAGGGDINRPMFDPRRHVVIEAALLPKQGQAALHGAAFWGWSDVVRFLVENGADLYLVDTAGKTVVDAAMGRAGGNGRLGVNITAFPETAAVLEELMAQHQRQTASAETNTTAE
jgi:ankyrin repeat protein